MAQVKERRLLAAFLAFALAIAGFMAFTVQSAWADDETIDVTFALIVPDENGQDAYGIDYTKTTMPAGSTAWDLTKKMFEENNIEFEYTPETAYGLRLDWIISPLTKQKLTWWDPSSGYSLNLFENGSYAQEGAGILKLKEGDSIVWNYARYSENLNSYTKSMFRLYNPNSGEHFYTMNEAEKDDLVKLGWNYESIGWTAPLASTVPVYRLYNANGGEHHYTMDKSERDNLVSVGWNDEGIGWYSDANESVKLYREYNPNQFANNHNYTTDKAEHDHLISLGWKSEDTAWYGVAINS